MDWEAFSTSRFAVSKFVVRGGRIKGRRGEGFVSYVGKRRKFFPIVALIVMFVTWEGQRTIVTIDGFYYCEERDCDGYPHPRQNATYTAFPNSDQVICVLSHVILEIHLRNRKSLKQIFPL